MLRRYHEHTLLYIASLHETTALWLVLIGELFNIDEQMSKPDGIHSGSDLRNSTRKRSADQRL